MIFTSPYLFSMGRSWKFVEGHRKPCKNTLLP